MNNIKKVLKYMLLGASLHDIDGNLIYINDSLKKMLNITNYDNYSNKSLSDGLFNDFIENKIDFEILSNNIKNISDEIVNIIVNNNKLWIKINSILYKNGEEYIIITYEDISKSFNYTHLYKEIFNNIKSGIVILKPYIDDYIIKDINPYAYELDNLDINDKIINKKLSDINLPPIDNKKFIEYVNDSYLNSKTIKLENINFSYIKNDKNIEYWRNVYIYPIKTGEIVVIYDDITDIVRYKDKLEESDRQKTKFISNMSHELRTPINTISGFSDLLKDMKDTNQKRNEYIDIIKDSSDILNNLVDDILDMSKIEAGKLSIDKKVFNVNKIINNLYLTFKNKTKKNVKLYKKTPLNELLIFNDDIRLTQVITNFLSNSCKFTDTGYIEFGYELNDDNVFFYVKDTGIGIKDEDKDKLFKRYQRLKTKDKKGNGLGLYISKEISNLMGAEISFLSEYKKGSKFCINVPIGIKDKNKAKCEVKNNPDKINIDLKDKTILLVEDVEFNQQLLISYLESTNVNIILAVDGNDALIKYNEHRDNIDLILMDIHMPNMNGTEVTETIRSIDSTTPIIAQTAYAMTNDIEDILKYGFNDLIKKPIKQNNLLAVVDKYIK